MLTCKEVTEKASQRVDGDLNLRERIGVWLHLMMCVNCRAYFRQFEALIASLAGGIQADEESPSADFVQRVMADIETTRDQSSTRPEEDPHQP